MYDKRINFRGLIACSYCVAQLVTSLPWGYASDIVGRRPCILFGLFGTAIVSTLFGMSKSFAFAIAMRTACGVVNGNLGVIKAMLGEMTDETNRGRAFGFWESAFGLGTIIGPVLGGLLVDPVKQYPKIFGGNHFLTEFPYFLPCFVGSVISLSGGIAGIFLLEETKKRKVRLPKLLDVEQNAEGAQARQSVNTLVDRFSVIEKSQKLPLSNNHSSIDNEHPNAEYQKIAHSQENFISKHWRNEITIGILNENDNIQTEEERPKLKERQSSICMHIERMPIIEYEETSAARPSLISRDSSASLILTFSETVIYNGI